ncbi:unnamed protein product [Allacma fusca]|uniref:Alpha-carbonic anhydrase domain-containing protein n=1 Tax=Allacma fusca TaxID=39272 RepID=A0A8J2NRY3_9HEXA|nr:unnamed protein product [Allacma fusca]
MSRIKYEKLLLVLFLSCFVAEQTHQIDQTKEEVIVGGKSGTLGDKDTQSAVQYPADDGIIKNVGSDGRIVFSRAAAHKSSSNTKEATNFTLHFLGGTPRVLDYTPEFSKWNTWPTNYPLCDPTTNPNLSPIIIDTKGATRDKTTPTLFVYSGTPITDYTLSTEFHGEPEFNMTALTISLTGERHHEATYVTGLGDTSYRFFEYALFLFSRKNKNPRLSLHQIDNKIFPMEIVMYFTTGRTEDDTTQIHVMVNISEIENPLLVPVVRAAKIIADRVTNTDANNIKIDAQQSKIDGMQAMILADTKAREEKGFYTYAAKLNENIEKIQKYGHEITRIREDLQSLENKNVSIREKIQRLENCVSNKTARQNDLGVRINELQLKADLESATNVLSKCSKNLEKEQNELKSTLDEIQSAQTKLNDCETALAKICVDLGLPERTTVSEAEEKHRKAQSTLADEAQAKADVNKEKQVLQQYKNELSLACDLEIFQVSWLLPASGGHYIYNGSLPVPPCTRRGFTIVMEHTVSISQEQFDTIAAVGDLPPFKHMKESLPVLAGSVGRKVRYNRKNLQFLLDDAVHMKSKLRKRIKVKMQDNQCNSLIGSIFLLVASIFSLIILFPCLRPQ